MRAAMLGALAGAGLVLAVVAGSEFCGELFAQRPPIPYQTAGPTGELIVVPLVTGEKHQLLTVVEPRQQVMGVYQVDPASGKISLWSVRNIRWDLQMTEFNTGNPPPREIRTLLEQR